MKYFLSRYVYLLAAVLALVIIGIIALLVSLFIARSSLSNPVVRNIRAIYRTGQANGNRPDVFSKVGDSITVAGNFLVSIGEGSYDLGKYDHLQPTINHYTQAQLRRGNSFSNASLAAGNGWSTLTVLDPDSAKPDACTYGLSPLVCEYQTSKPSIALIMLGTNDVSFLSVEEYRANMQRIIGVSVEMGVIPVISTIPQRVGYADKVLAYNAVLRELARENRVPLWDYAGALRFLPNGGISSDGVHPNAPPWNQSGGAAQFTDEALEYGFTVRNLTALEMLHSVRQAVR